MCERAIAVCEAHGLHDWVIYPQSLLAHLLVLSGVDLELAEALVRAYRAPAEAGQDLWLTQRLHTTLMWLATKRADWTAVKDAFQASLACGGPYPVLLQVMLGEIEETCCGTGTVPAAATFRDLCRELIEGYARAGLEPPLQQWYLVSTCPLPVPGEPWLHEEFEEEGEHPALRWQDATGRSRIDRASRPGWLGVYHRTGGPGGHRAETRFPCVVRHVSALVRPTLTATATGPE